MDNLVGRCEWYNDYEKGITKPPIRVSDLEVVELNFRGAAIILFIVKLISTVVIFIRNNFVQPIKAILHVQNS
jgi:hypothetical protein